MAKYIVCQYPVRHNGVRYARGEHVELNPKEAKRLGELVALASKAAPKDPKKNEGVSS